jgi:hypothetical protein
MPLVRAAIPRGITCVGMSCMRNSLGYNGEEEAVVVLFVAGVSWTVEGRVVMGRRAVDVLPRVKLRMGGLIMVAVLGVGVAELA